jgi:hypothetical protein
VWLLKLLAELNHRRWFSATDINTDLGGELASWPLVCAKVWLFVCGLA